MNLRTDSRRTQHPQLVAAQNCEAADPRFNLFALEYFDDPRYQHCATGIGQAYEQYSEVRPKSEFPSVGKVEVLHDEKSRIAVSCCSDGGIVISRQAFLPHAVNVVVQF